MLPKTFKLFDFPIFWHWTYPMKVISRNESCTLNYIYTFLIHTVNFEQKKPRAIVYTINFTLMWLCPSWPWSYGSWIYNYLYATSVYYHWCCEFESQSGRGVQHYVIKFISDLLQVGGFSPNSPVSSTNKTDHHDLTEILLKVALNITKQTKQSYIFFSTPLHITLLYIFFDPFTYNITLYFLFDPFTYNITLYFFFLIEVVHMNFAILSVNYFLVTLVFFN